MSRAWTQKEDAFLEGELRRRVDAEHRRSGSFGADKDAIVKAYRRRFSSLSADRTDSAILRRIGPVSAVIEPEDYWGVGQ